MKTLPALGTILPDARIEMLSDIQHRKDVLQREATGRKHLSQYHKTTVEGETRYYDGPNRYAIVSRRDCKSILWFVFHNEKNGWFRDK